MSSDVELLPCPWCGEKLASVSVSEGSTFRWRKVDGCCADGPEVRHNTMADDQEAAEVESRTAAIAAWNTRAYYDGPALDGFYGVVDCCDAKGCWLVLTDEATDITRGQRVRLVPEPPAEANGVEGAELRAIHSCHDQCHRPACVRRQRDELRAEVERLTFEISCLQQQYDERTAYVIVHRGAALACSDAMRAAYSEEHYRADRLAEALRDVRARTADLAAWFKSGNDVPADLPFVFSERWQKIAADIRALEAAVGATQ